MKDSLNCLVSSGSTTNPAWPKAVSIKALGEEKLAFDLWRVVIAPLGTPDDVKSDIVKLFSKAVETESFKKFLESQGERASLLSGLDLKKEIVREFEELKGIAAAVTAN